MLTIVLAGLLAASASLLSVNVLIASKELVFFQLLTDRSQVGLFGISSRV